MFKQVDPRPDFPKQEEQVLKFWEKNNIFEKSLKKNFGKERFVFFEGPPTANGRPGLHHVEARSFKDVVLRYQTMKGKYAPRRAGWDTHGLPVEIGVEKSLGISGKKQIENLVKGDKRASIEKFNKLCRESVWKYKEEWEQFTKRMGFWIDLKSPYITYENEYIESVWALLKKMWSRKVNGESLIYQGHKVVPYCPRCGTAISSHEVAQGYEKVEENSLYFQLRLSEKKIEAKDKKGHPEIIKLDKPTYFLSWTTTPWTLPGNVALAVGKNIDYSIVRFEKQNFIIASELAEKVIQGKIAEIAKVKGRYLTGLSYEPIFEVQELKSEKSFKVYSADFVNTEDGTGIVHTAVMYGEDDYNLGTEIGLPKFHTVTDDGKFIKSLGDISGLFVKDKKIEDKIVAYLKSKNSFFKEKKYIHDYPFCWRCKTALLYYARNSWFIRMSALREELLKNNEQINWVPEYIKDGRFGGWLKEAKDWAISRERYWGVPLPFWQCQQCKEYEVVGSIKELGENLKDLHIPYIDEVKLKCGKCKGQMIRTPEVIDVWFDSGAMPFAQWHYPIENEQEFKANFPADYITEAIDQTRGWFYTLLAVSTALGKDKPPFRNVINLGHILDGHGKKMSKSKGNIVEPFPLMDKYGIDIVRWYMYTVNQPGDNKNFSEVDLVSYQRRVQMILWNVYIYFLTYANATNWEFTSGSPDDAKNSSNVLDQWIKLRLQELVNGVTGNLDEYNVFRASRSIEEFVTDLSTWYIRRSRGRIDANFFASLHRTLIYLVKILAPFMPFFSETIYSNLHQTGSNYPESVHLDDWPEKKPLSESDKKILNNMREIRNIVESVLSWRKSNNIKVRQPLSDLLIKSDKDELQSYSYLLADELNFVNIQVSKDASIPTGFDKIDGVAGKHPEIYINKILTPELKAQGMSREIERTVQSLRKESGLSVGQLVDFYYETKSKEVYDAFEYFDQNKTYVTRVIGARQKADFEKDIKINGQRIWIGLKKAINENSK